MKKIWWQFFDKVLALKELQTPLTAVLDLLLVIPNPAALFNWGHNLFTEQGRRYGNLINFSRFLDELIGKLYWTCFFQLWGLQKIYLKNCNNFFKSLHHFQQTTNNLLPKCLGIFFRNYSCGDYIM